MTWIPLTERLPQKAGTYPVFIPTADPTKPLRHVASFSFGTSSSRRSAAHWSSV